MVTVAQQNFTEPVKASILLVLSFYVVSASLGRNVSSSYHLDFPVSFTILILLSVGEAGAFNAGRPECVLSGLGRYLYSGTALRLLLYLSVFGAVLVALGAFWDVEKRTRLY